MGLRIGFDMDGVLADFSSAFREVELRLFDGAVSAPVELPEVEAVQGEAVQGEKEEKAEARGGATGLREARRRRDKIWQAIQQTPDFWTTLEPLDPDAVRRIHELTVRHRWEVFFITQRPATVGQSVQRQTQLWLRRQGFELPSVLVISGPRGAAAKALRLNYHVDDNTQHCLDVSSESGARPLLIVPERDKLTDNSARRLGLSVARSIGEALDTLEQIALGNGREPRLIRRLSRMAGWT